MALVQTVTRSKLQIQVEEGLNKDGEMQFSTISFTRIAETATDEAVRIVGEAIGALQSKKVSNVLRVNEVILQDK